MVTNREIFNQIAESWYGFRHYTRFSQELSEVAKRWHGGKLLNIGCAHGPDFLPFKDNFELWGADFSEKMVRMAQRYAAKFGFEAKLKVADALFLPYADSTFDWAIAVATYHHIKGDAKREEALKELKRVLKPGAEIFITVWNRWQPAFWVKGKETQIAWNYKGVPLYRYYYLFSYGELNRLLTRCGFKVIRMFPEKTYRLPVKFFSRNICVLARVM
jgi:ubiquinone/menaquinone biosynthesis C-methylase UbiE